MKINNEKGWFCFSVMAANGAWPLVQSAFVGMAGLLMLACAWHIPAWEKAKDAGGDAPSIYQAQKMWPQNIACKLPGGDCTPNMSIKYVTGNGGNFAGGIDKT